MKPSEFKISISVETYDEKTAENYRNGYVAVEALRSGWIRSCRVGSFIVLNDSVSPKMVIKMYFNFFQFF